MTPEKQLALLGAQLYDAIGGAYTTTRRTEPRIAAQIWDALGDARSVLNVGGKTGSYEPADRDVIAVEPSAVMRGQRPAGSAPCVDATAEQLPFEEQSFDAAMAVSTVHHWGDVAAGLREMRRVARRVVVLTFDTDEPGWMDRFWLTRDYLPEFADVLATFPSLAGMADTIGARVEPVPVPWDCADGLFEAYWRRSLRPIWKITYAERHRCGRESAPRPNNGRYAASPTTSPRAAGPHTTATSPDATRQTSASACSQRDARPRGAAQASPAHAHHAPHIRDRAAKLDQNPTRTRPEPPLSPPPSPSHHPTHAAPFRSPMSFGAPHGPSRYTEHVGTPNKGTAPMSTTRQQPTTHIARRMFELLEPICLVTFTADECNKELAALGHCTYWDGYFASRAAPLGRVPAHVVHAAFYNFADGEVARHIPSAWETIPPAASVAARERGSAASCGASSARNWLAPGPGARRGPDHQGSDQCPTEGRVMYAGMRTLDVPGDPVARLWHSATMLREHRGDGHIAALLGAHIDGTEAHVLSALDMDIHPAESFGRIHHLPKERLATVMDGLRERGLIDADGYFTNTGRATKQRIEALTDELATPPYDALSPPNSTNWSPNSSPSPRPWWPQTHSDAQRRTATPTSTTSTPSRNCPKSMPAPAAVLTVRVAESGDVAVATSCTRGMVTRSADCSEQRVDQPRHHRPTPGPVIVLRMRCPAKRLRMDG